MKRYSWSAWHWFITLCFVLCAVYFVSHLSLTKNKKQSTNHKYKAPRTTRQALRSPAYRIKHAQHVSTENFAHVGFRITAAQQFLREIRQLGNSGQSRRRD